MKIKTDDKFEIVGKELPIRVVTAKGDLVYDKAGVVFMAGEWPNYKITVQGAVDNGLIKPVGAGVVEAGEVE